MARRGSGRTKRPGSIEPRVKVWLEVDGRYAFGYGLAEILRAVDKTRSIKRAAASLDKSYRYVWKRIKQAERVLGETLVETQVGGQGVQRSALTDTARRLAADYLAMRDRMIAVMEQEYRRRLQRNST